MKVRKKLLIFWGVVIVAFVVVMNGLRHLFGGGERRFNGFRHGRMGEAGQFANQGGFGPHSMMYGPHYGGGFHFLGLLLFLIIGLAVLILVVRWLRKRSKSSARNEFVDVPMKHTSAPVINPNGRILDEWEKSVLNKKEDE